MIVIIAGASRSGKTTVCKRICTELNMNYIPFDSIISTLERLYPDTGMKHQDNNIEFSPILAKFVAEFISHVNYEDIDVVIDLYQLFPNDYKKYVEKLGIPIIYLGYHQLTVNEKLKELRSHQREKDWTNETDDIEMGKILKLFLSESKKMYEQCIKLDMPYFNTGKNFDKEIENAIDYIKKINKVSREI
ncbi:MAG: hypothetical protein OCD02_05835 [Spirochaetaceae bacterium]